MHLHPFAIGVRGCTGSRSVLLKDSLVAGRRRPSIRHQSAVVKLGWKQPDGARGGETGRNLDILEMFVLSGHIMSPFQWLALKAKVLKTELIFINGCTSKTSPLLVGGDSFGVPPLASDGVRLWFSPELLCLPCPPRGSLTADLFFLSHLSCYFDRWLFTVYKSTSAPPAIPSPAITPPFCAFWPFEFPSSCHSLSPHPLLCPSILLLTPLFPCCLPPRRIERDSIWSLHACFRLALPGVGRFAALASGQWNKHLPCGAFVCFERCFLK